MPEKTDSRSRAAETLLARWRKSWGVWARWLNHENGGVTAAAAVVGVGRKRFAQWCDGECIPDADGQTKIIAAIKATEARLAAIAAKPGPLEERWVDHEADPAATGEAEEDGDA